jgi:hypothetical protein
VSNTGGALVMNFTKSFSSSGVRFFTFGRAAVELAPLGSFFFLALAGKFLLGSSGNVGLLLTIYLYTMLLVACGNLCVFTMLTGISFPS